MGKITGYYPIEAPDFNIYKKGSRYVAAGRTGTLRDTSLNQLWQDINATLSRGPVVEFAASTTADPFVVDASLEVEYEKTVIGGQSPQATVLKLANSVNDDVIKNAGGNYYRNTLIQDIMIHGNRDNNTSGRGIEWIVNAATGGSSEYYAWLTMRRIGVTECDDAGIRLQTTTGALTSVVLEDFRLWDNNGEETLGYQLVLDRISDSWIGFGGKNVASSMKIMGTSCGTNHFNGIYFGGGIDNCIQLAGGSADYPNTGHIFTNCRFDNAAGTALQLNNYARRNQWIGCVFTNLAQGMADNTFPCIEVNGNAYSNMWKDCYMGHNNIVTTDRWNYAFQETMDSYSKLIGCTTGYGSIQAGNAEHFGSLEADLVASSHTDISKCLRDDGGLWRQS